MNLTIHRGTHEIGGSCVELSTDSTRIIIDIGLPLVDEDRNAFDSNSLKKYSKDEFIKNIFPYLYDFNSNDKKIDAVLISHPHQDHYGLLSYISSEIPVYLSRGTKELIEITSFFGKNSIVLSNPIIIKAWQTFEIGDIKITPYLADHSGFDAMSFFIEANNKRIFYTGDFRGHGRKKKVFDEIIKNPPSNIDYLILEGTCIEGKNNDNKSEIDIEKELTQSFANNKMTFISYSSQNIDRIVSIYKACMKINKIFVIDPYTAYVLDKLKGFGSIPQPEWNENFRIYFASDGNTQKIADKNELFKFKSEKISEEEIRQNQKRIVIRNSYRIRKKFEYLINSKDTQLVYSQWKNYFDNEKEFWGKHSIEPYYIHTSGHAFVSELVEFANALNPAKIIPIHTFAPDKFKEYFGDKAQLLNDEKRINL